MRKRVGILGSGEAAQALANKFLKHGYEVMLGTRDVKGMRNWFNSSGDNAWVGSYEDTAHFGDLLILVVRSSSAEFILDLAGAANLHGKTVIDACDSISKEMTNSFANQKLSLIESLQKKYSRIHFVKVFNNLEETITQNQRSRNGSSTLLICGNNENAKNNVRIALKTIGCNIKDCGSIEVARNIESFVTA